MKYTIEQTDDGCIETLELAGEIYIKNHEGDGSGTSTSDKDFWEQMEVNGVPEDVLDKVYKTFDSKYMAIDFLGIANEKHRCRRRTK